MRNLFLGVVVLLSALPLFATISQVQSAAMWSQTGTTCVVPFTSSPTAKNLIVVWTSWKTSIANGVTASVKDSLGNGTGSPATFPSAVGPTIQSASNTAGQIFYAVVTNGGSPDTVTVTFSLAPSSSNCVIAEYMGVDVNNPLDSVSAGYSLSAVPTGLLDSGNVAPANSNLLVFGAGMSDNGTATLTGSSPFTVVQRNGGGITEYNIVSASSSLPLGNNTLQRATALLTPSPTTGNWLMQMAVFRDASWSVTGGWSPTRTSATRYAQQFPGATADVKINNAIADLPYAGGIVDATGFGCGSQTVAGSVAVGGAGKPVKLILNPCTQYHVTAAVGSTQDVIQIGAGSGVVEQGNSGGTVSGGSNFNFIVDPGANFQCMFAPANRQGGQESWFLDGVNIIGDYVTQGVAGAGVYSQGLVCVEGGGTNSRVSNVYTSSCWGPSALFITSSYGRSGTGNGRTTGDTQFFNNNWDCTGTAQVATVNIATPSAYSAYNQVANLNFFGDNIQHSCCVNNASSSPYNSNVPLMLMCVENTSSVCVPDSVDIAIKTINFWGSYFEAYSASTLTPQAPDAVQLQNTLDVHVNGGSMEGGPGSFSDASFYLANQNGNFTLTNFYTTASPNSVDYYKTSETAPPYVQTWSATGDLSETGGSTNRFQNILVKGSCIG